MGVYHLMGLGRSPGVVIGPITYLGHRYQRWNEDDKKFFARSGEAKQREEGKKVGDIQALVLFTTKEVLNGRILSFGYVMNPAGRISKTPLREGGPMKDILKELLKEEWPKISGERRKSGTIFWCEIDRRDIKVTYERVVQVIAALSGVGKRGKEIWVNLTGGNNVVNSALQIASSLSGSVARMYYVQAENEDAEKCIRYTAENGYWVELPVLPLIIDPVGYSVIEMLQEKPMSLEQLYGNLKSLYWKELNDKGIDDENKFHQICLFPLWKAGLIAETPKEYTIGPQWEVIQPYRESLEKAKERKLTIEQLARQEDWIEMEELEF